MTFNRAFFQTFPKAELHEHLDGSLRPSFMLETAKKNSIALPFTNEAECFAWVNRQRGGSLVEYLKLFDTTVSVLQTPEALGYAAIQTLEDWTRAGILYGEIRFAPELHTRAGMTQEDAVNAVIEGLKEGERRTGTPWAIILCMLRHSPAGKELPALCAKLKTRGIPVALDLAGPELGNPAQDYAESFLAARESGIPVTIHAGEAAGPESIAEALQQGASRLGHGVRLVEEWNGAQGGPLTALILNKKITLEMCPSSNLQTGAWKDLATYPLRRYLDAGIQVTINTDNRLVSSTDLPGEWELLFGNESQAEILAVTTINSFLGAFHPEVRTKEWVHKHLFPKLIRSLGKEAALSGEEHWEEESKG